MKKNILLLLLLVVAGCKSAEAPPEIVIGGLLHLTGEIAVQGEAFRQGMELAAAAINRERAKPIALRFEDTQYKPLEALTGVKRLLEIPSLSAVLISTVTEAKAAGPELQKAKKPGLVLWDSSPEIEAIGSQLFGIGPWTPASSKTAATFAANSLRAKSAAVVSSNTEWSQSIGKQFADNFKGAGGELLSRIELNPQESDFRTVLYKIKQAAPNLLFAPVDANIPAFFAQAKQIIPQIPILTADIITDDLISENEAAYQGVYQVMTRSLRPEKLAQLSSEYREKFGSESAQLTFVAWAYDAVQVVVAALDRQSQSGHSLADEIRSTKNYDGYSGTISFNENGSAPRELAVARVVGRNFVSVAAQP